MNAEERFLEESQSSTGRGVDGLLDEGSRIGTADDLAFLGELERRFDHVDRAAASVVDENKTARWHGWAVAKVAAALAVLLGVVYAASEQWVSHEVPEVALYDSVDTNANANASFMQSVSSIEAVPVSAPEPDASGVEFEDVIGDVMAGTQPEMKRDSGLSGGKKFVPLASPTPVGNDSAVTAVQVGATRGLEALDSPADGWGVPTEEVLLAGRKKFTPRRRIRQTPNVSFDSDEAGKGLSLVDASQKDTLSDRERYFETTSLYRGAISSQSQVRYPPLVDNTFRSPKQDPLSTFSIDVDTASYSNVRRMIQAGEAVPKDAVRIEELINYFDYSYARPGEELPFSVSLESAACPWKPGHRLVRVGLKGKEIMAEKRQALNLVFLVDVSGSMNQERKLPLVQRSLHLLIDQLRDEDSITIVTYAGSEGIALQPTKGSDKTTMHRAVDGLRSSGGTNGEAGIRLAYRLASTNYSNGGVNRILLATDGDFNVGISSTEDLRDMVKQEAKRGVYLSVLGFGSDNLNDAMLETITNDGNGTYHYIDSVSEGRKVLVEDITSTMITIAKDVKIQVEFNPSTVGAYRLIGYANRMLPPEAFNDDRVDAGDIGAGHTVTAFYEIIPPGMANETVDKLKYQTPTAEPSVSETTGRDDRDVASSNELLTVKLRYKSPQSDVSRLIEVPFTDNGRSFIDASADFRFGASVAAFGMLLRESDYRGTLTRTQIRAAAAGAMNEDSGRKEFIELIDNAVLPGDR